MSAMIGCWATDVVVGVRDGFDLYSIWGTIRALYLGGRNMAATFPGKR